MHVATVRFLLKDHISALDWNLKNDKTHQDRSKHRDSASGCAVGDVKTIFTQRKRVPSC